MLQIGSQSYQNYLYSACKEILLSFVLSVLCCDKRLWARRRLPKVRPCKLCCPNVSLFWAAAVHSSPVSHQKSSPVHCTTPYKQTRALLWEGTVTRCNNCQASDRCACSRKWSAQDFPCNIRPTIRWRLFERLLWEFLVSLLFCISWCLHTFCFQS